MFLPPLLPFVWHLVRPWLVRALFAAMFFGLGWAVR